MIFLSRILFHWLFNFWNFISFQPLIHRRFSLLFCSFLSLSLSLSWQFGMIKQAKLNDQSKGRNWIALEWIGDMTSLIECSQPTFSQQKRIENWIFQIGKTKVIQEWYLLLVWPFGNKSIAHNCLCFQLTCVRVGWELWAELCDRPWPSLRLIFHWTKNNRKRKLMKFSHCRTKSIEFQMKCWKM